MNRKAHLNNPLTIRIIKKASGILRETRAARNETIKHVALAAGVSPYKLKAMESGLVNFSFADFLGVCRYYQLNAIEVLEDPGED